MEGSHEMAGEDVKQLSGDELFMAKVLIRGIANGIYQIGETSEEQLVNRERAKFLMEEMLESINKSNSYPISSEQDIKLLVEVIPKYISMHEAETTREDIPQVSIDAHKRYIQELESFRKQFLEDPTP